MNGIWILLLLTLTAALPAIIAYCWFRSKKPVVTLPWFLASVSAGILSFIIAGLAQDLFTMFRQNTPEALFFSIFIRIALVEEASRLVTLIPILRVGKDRQKIDRAFGAALGLAAGLGFAIIESAYHGLTDLNITLLRAFTAAPLHGACGIRAGKALFLAGQHPQKALLLFLSTVLIHGAYNLMIISPAIPSAFAIFVALAALFSSLTYLKDTNDGIFS